MTNGLKMGQWSVEDASKRKLADEITYVAKYCGSASASLFLLLPWYEPGLEYLSVYLLGSAPDAELKPLRMRWPSVRHLTLLARSCTGTSFHLLKYSLPRSHPKTSLR